MSLEVPESNLMELHSSSQVQEAEVGAGSSTGIRPSESKPIVDQSAMPAKGHLRPVILPIVCAIALITAIAAGTAILLLGLRDRALANSEREMKNTALILAEQSDRAFQTLELV